MLLLCLIVTKECLIMQQLNIVSIYTCKFITSLGIDIWFMIIVMSKQ